MAALYDGLATAHGLTEHRPTFALREVHQAVAEWAGDRLDAEAISALAERFLADSRVVLLDVAGRRRRNRPEPVYTTVDLLEAEADLITLCRQASSLAVPAALVDHAVAVVGDELRRHTRHRQAGLTGEQASVVRAMLAGGRMVRPVIGPAGTGKTETMRAVVHAAAAAGHRVVATANGGRQTEEPAARLGVPARVVSGWLTLLDHTEDPTIVWPRGTVLVLDEATQVSTRDARRLLQHAAATGTVVIAVGDPAQLGAVGAGGWFAHLVSTSADVPALTGNQRQRGPHLAEVRTALAELRSPNPEHAQQALDRLAADGRLRICENRDELLAAVVSDWHADRRGGHSTARKTAERHADAELLNRAARETLRADGSLTGPRLRAAGREFQAGDEVITLTQQGHTLVPTGQSRAAYIRTGTVGTVTAVHLGQNALTVHFPGKGEVRIGWDYLTHSFPDGRDGGLAHAYALTAHKAEGATLPTARAVAAEDTSRAGLYVMLSRGRHDVRAYLIARADLDHAPDDETWLPILKSAADSVERFADRLEHGQPERLAHDRNPHAAAAHQLRLRHSLAELTELRRSAETGHRPDVDVVVIGWAERAAEIALAAAAVTDPPPALLSRIGPRPSHGPDRDLWDAAVTAVALYRARHHPYGPAHQLGAEPDMQPDDDRAGRGQRQRAAAEHVPDAGVAVVLTADATAHRHDQWRRAVALLDTAQATYHHRSPATGVPRPHRDPELAVADL